MADILTFTRHEDGTIAISHEDGRNGGVDPSVTHGDAVMRLTNWLRGDGPAVLGGISASAGPIQTGPDKFPAS